MIYMPKSDGHSQFVELPQNHTKRGVDGWEYFGDDTDENLKKLILHESKTAYHSGFASGICEAVIALHIEGNGGVGITYGYNNANDIAYGHPLTLAEFAPQWVDTDNKVDSLIVSAKITLTYADGTIIEREFTE